MYLKYTTGDRNVKKNYINLKKTKWDFFLN